MDLICLHRRAKDDEQRLPETTVKLHVLVFAYLLLRCLMPVHAESA